MQLFAAEIVADLENSKQINRIEFVGGSGVGKTTVFREVIKQRPDRKLFLTPVEGRIHIVKKLYPGLWPPNRRSLIRLNFFSQRHELWSREILEKFADEAIGAAGDAYDGLIHLFFQYLNGDNIHFIQKLALSELYFKKLLYEVILLDYFLPSEKILFDEGIISLNGGVCNYSIYEQKVMERSMLSRIRSNPAGIIHCKLPPEKNFLRMQKRIQLGVGNYRVKTMDEKTLLSKCRKGVHAAQGIANVMKKAGVPVLEIDLEQKPSDNARMVIEFVKSLE